MVKHETAGPRRPPHGTTPLAELWTGIDEDVEPALARLAGDVALDLTIAVPASETLTQGRHLDNYLLTVVSRLGQRRIPAAFARKVHGDVSSVRLAPARYRTAEVPPAMTVRARGGSEAPGWKEQVTEACAAAARDDTPTTQAVVLDLGFVVSSLRNWTTLWKPTIDALGPLLGTSASEAPWAPRARDDRIVELGLHRTTDNSVGYDVVIRAWWRGQA